LQKLNGVKAELLVAVLVVCALVLLTALEMTGREISSGTHTALTGLITLGAGSLIAMTYSRFRRP
tara:strand:- start:223 stop:417 length:195 start_codon:yes stop_codon:yes gene_type:complete